MNNYKGDQSLRIWGYKIFAGIALTFFLIFSLSSLSYAKQSWNVWLQQLKQEAIAEGISPQLFDEVFRGVYPNRRVINLDRSQPERRLTFLKYRKTRISAYRIKLGRYEYKRYRNLLTQIGNEYGVDPCFITAFWGIESSYGRYMGKFPVIKSLATLAYDGRRGAFFRKQLLIALHILNEGHVDNAHFKGEWAGASGHPQFLPSSWYKYAVDYNKDGHKDIWRSYGDVFASIANYLKQNGWQTNQPWGIEVNLPRNFDKKLEGLKHQLPMSEWLKMGVKPRPGEQLPHENLMASIVTPYGGPAFMAFKNYRVIMKYNNSIFYAGSVGYLADKICRRK